MTSQPPAAPGAQKQGAASSEFTPEPLTEANKAALEQATKAPPPAPPPARTGGSGCLPADAEELRATFEQLTRGHKDAAALWESFQVPRMFCSCNRLHSFPSVTAGRREPPPRLRCVSASFV